MLGERSGLGMSVDGNSQSIFWAKTLPFDIIFRSNRIMFWLHIYIYRQRWLPMYNIFTSPLCADLGVPTLQRGLCALLSKCHLSHITMYLLSLFLMSIRGFPLRYQFSHGKWPKKWQRLVRAFWSAYRSTLEINQHRRLVSRKNVIAVFIPFLQRKHDYTSIW